MTMPIRKPHWGRPALLVTALAAATLPACILDIETRVLVLPSDGGEPDVIDFTDRDPDIPDIDFTPEVLDCDVECPVQWSPACSGDTNWCISPYRGNGNCCEAWEDCQGIGTFPGFWPTAGPYNGIVPADFFDFINLPGITIVYAGISAPSAAFSLSCLDTAGIKPNEDGGEMHMLAIPVNCAAEECTPFLGNPICSGENVGCSCTMPYWCYSQ